MRSRLWMLSLAVVTAATVGCGRGQVDDEPSVDVPALAARATPSGQPDTAGDGVSPATAADDPARAFSATDVEFLATMLAHHTAAQRMAELAEQRAAAPELRAFAASLRAAQRPEIDQMAAWLAGLGVDPGTTVGGGHDHGGATPQQVGDLQELNGSAFDRAFLDLVADHSVGAAALARAEVDRGFNTAVRQLAGRIVDREWADMQTLRRLG